MVLLVEAGSGQARGAWRERVRAGRMCGHSRVGAGGKWRGLGNAAMGGCGATRAGPGGRAGCAGPRGRDLFLSQTQSVHATRTSSSTGATA